MPVPGQRVVLLRPVDMIVGRTGDASEADIDDQLPTVAVLFLRRLAETQTPGDGTDSATVIVEVPTGLRSLQEALTAWTDLDKHQTTVVKHSSAAATCSTQLRENVTTRVRALITAFAPPQATISWTDHDPEQAA